jgi:cytochrome c oxidase subunit I+III
LVTTPIEARPQYVLRMPGPGWAHVLAAIFTAAFFLLLTVKMVVTAVICGILAIVSCLWWAWQLDPEPRSALVDIGGGIRLPTSMSGPASHSWGAMIVVILVAASLYLSYVFSYLYLWTLAPKSWASASPLPEFPWPLSAGLLLIAAVGAFFAAGRSLPPPGTRHLWPPILLLLGAACLIAYLIVEAAGHWQAGLRPTSNSHAAMVYMASFLSSQVIAATAIMALFAVARYFTGRLNAQRRVPFECTALLAYYAAGQGLVGLVLVHGFPRLVG